MVSKTTIEQIVKDVFETIGSTDPISIEEIDFITEHINIELNLHQGNYTKEEALLKMRQLNFAMKIKMLEMLSEGGSK